MADGWSPYDLSVSFAEVLRETLTGRPARSALDHMLERVCARTGYSASVVHRLQGDRLLLQGSFGIDSSHVGDGDIAVSEGIAGAAATSGEVQIVVDASSDGRWLDVSGGQHKSGLCIPMHVGNEVWGVLTLESPEVGAFTAEDGEALRPFADSVAWALEAMRLREEAQARAARQTALTKGFEAVTAVITAALESVDLEQSLNRMLREMNDRLGFESIGIYLADGDRMRAVALYGVDEQYRDYRPTKRRGIIGHVMTTGEPYLCPDVREDPYYEDILGDTRSELCVPLKVSGVVRGIINAESPRVGRFSREDLEVMVRVADQMSLVMHNLELLQKEKETVAQLHDLDRLKSRLMTIASHELRTPLTVVLGFAEVLSGNLAALSDEKVQHYADAIVRQASSLSKLVDQMMLAAQIEQGSIGIVPSPVDLDALVRKCVEEREGAPIEILPGVEGKRVKADPMRLGEVIGNLLDNAIKYASHGIIQINARSDGDRIIILLRDEGPGIPGAEHERVFEPFHQIGEHGVAGKRGIGLGLAVARDLVRLMNGEMRLASAEGYGATFLVELDRA